MIDLGNEKDIADYVLHAHGSPQSSASASMDGGGGGGHKTEASEEHAGNSSVPMHVAGPGLDKCCGCCWYTKSVRKLEKKIESASGKEREAATHPKRLSAKRLACQTPGPQAVHVETAGGVGLGPRDVRWASVQSGETDCTCCVWYHDH